MWPVVYALGTRFSRYLVLPIAAVIGTVGYYVERKLVPRRPQIEYLGTSIQDQRAQRQLTSSGKEMADLVSPNSLNIVKPTPDN